MPNNCFIFVHIEFEYPDPVWSWVRVQLPATNYSIMAFLNQAQKNYSFRPVTIELHCILRVVGQIYVFASRIVQGIQIWVQFCQSQPFPLNKRVDLWT